VGEREFLFISLIVVVIVFLWYLTFTAGRLDRLHHRVETSWASLDALLQQRAALALEVSHLPGGDPALSLVLTQSAYLAAEAEIDERSSAEEGLTATLEMLDETEDFLTRYPALSERLHTVQRKIDMAISLHKEAVATTRAQRSRLIVRIFRLAGHAPLPVTHPFEEKV
jgi:hypothetical protein